MKSASRSVELRKHALKIARGLEKAYPDAVCALSHEDPYQLLVATILSAQCTDARVNQVTPALFARVMFLAGEESIREVIPFPKTTGALDLMTGSPSAVAGRQLDELGLKLKS